MDSHAHYPVTTLQQLRGSQNYDAWLFDLKAACFADRLWPLFIDAEAIIRPPLQETRWNVLRLVLYVQQQRRLRLARALFIRSLDKEIWAYVSEKFFETTHLPSCVRALEQRFQTLPKIEFLPPPWNDIDQTFVQFFNMKNFLELHGFLDVENCILQVIIDQLPRNHEVYYRDWYPQIAQGPHLTLSRLRDHMKRYYAGGGTIQGMPPIR